MKREFVKSNLFLKLLLATAAVIAVVSLAGCSYRTVFVVVNESSDRIQIRYVVKKPAEPNRIATLDPPAVLAVSELEERIPWRELPSTMFTFNEETRTALVTLLPNQALRVDQMTDGKCDATGPRYEEGFGIEEINIVGSSGMVRLTGEQARKSFISGRKGMCTLTYR